MHFVRHDGGRPAHVADDVCDCTARAISIALERPYEEISAELLYVADRPCFESHRGLPSGAMRGYLHWLGWRFQAGDDKRLDFSVLPPGRLIVDLRKLAQRFPRHVAAVIDGTLFDLEDCRTGYVVGFYSRVGG